MRIALLNWRDLTHPEGGGAERYAQTVCAGLARRGHDVTMFCAAHPGAAPGRGDRRLPHRAARWPLDRLPRDAARARPVESGARRLRRRRRHAERAAVLVAPRHAGRRSSASCTTSTASSGRSSSDPSWRASGGRSSRASRLGSIAAAPTSPCRAAVATSSSASASAATTSTSSTTAPTGRWRSASRGAAAPTVVVLGRLVPHKRVELAIDALERLRAPRARRRAADRRRRLVAPPGRGARPRGGARRRRPLPRLRRRGDQAPRAVACLGRARSERQGGLGAQCRRGCLARGADRGPPRGRWPVRVDRRRPHGRARRRRRGHGSRGRPAAPRRGARARSMGERAREHAALHSWEGAVDVLGAPARARRRTRPSGRRAPVGQQREAASA